MPYKPATLPQSCYCPGAYLEIVRHQRVERPQPSFASSHHTFLPLTVESLRILEAFALRMLKSTAAPNARLILQTLSPNK